MKSLKSVRVIDLPNGDISLVLESNIRRQDDADFLTNRIVVAESRSKFHHSVQMGFFSAEDLLLLHKELGSELRRRGLLWNQQTALNDRG